MKKKQFRLSGEGKFRDPVSGVQLEGDVWSMIVFGTTSQTVQGTKNQHGKDLKVVEVK